MPEPDRTPPTIDIFATGRWVVKHRVPVDKISTWHITILAESLARQVPHSTEEAATSNEQLNCYLSLAASLIRDQLRSVAWRSTILGLAFGHSKDLHWINQDQIANLAESIAATARKYLRWNPDSEERHYCRCMVSIGIVWCCQVLEYEGSLDDPERFRRLDTEETRHSDSVR
jgi:hypothetical protein